MALGAVARWDDLRDGSDVRDEMTSASVNELLAAVGPNLPDVEGVLQRGEDEWLVRFPDIDVALEFDEASKRLMLSADLDRPAPGNHVAVYEALMGYTLLWRETGGVAAALSAEGVVVILLTLYAAELDQALLATVLGNFAERARLLKTFVAQGGEAPEERNALFTTAIRI